MKREALKAVRGGLRGFRRRIREYTGQELVYIADTDNLRREVGQFALPVRLHREYIGFIRACADFPGEVALGGEEVDRTVSARYPKFASCYDIQGLYPPSLLREHSDPRRHTPIYFKTNTGEKKFLLAGLHSGGKSFLLENLVLLSILGQIPFEMSADKLVIPRYKHIFYYNADNSRGRENGSGKWEAEMRQVNRIIDQARAGDLVVFDEFLDSTHSSVSTWLLPEILGRLGRLAATVFVSTHRGVDYQAIQDTGWVVMSPEHKVKEGKIVPIHRLKRGIPDEQANQAYVKQRYQDALKRHSY